MAQRESKGTKKEERFVLTLFPFPFKHNEFILSWNRDLPIVEKTGDRKFDKREIEMGSVCVGG